MIPNQHPPATQPEATALAAALAAEVQAVRIGAADLRAAHANPLPGPLAAAFDPDPVSVAGFQIRPVVASDFAILRRLDSPLHRRTLELAEHQRQIAAGTLPPEAAPPETQFTEEELAEMVYQFTQPVRQVRAELARGRDAFRETALVAISDRLGVLDLPALVAAVVANFTAAFGPALGHAAPSAEGEETVNFSRPPAPATAWAGGSISSPGSAASTAGRPIT